MLQFLIGIACTIAGVITIIISKKASDDFTYVNEKDCRKVLFFMGIAAVVIGVAVIVIKIITKYFI